MTEPLDLDALRRLAEAATQPTGGTRWVLEGGPLGCDVFSGPVSNDSCDIATGIFHREDGEFIAATDPPTVLALLDALAEHAKTVEYFDAQSKRRRDERDAALAELADLRAQVEASTARARDAITEDATS